MALEDRLSSLIDTLGTDWRSGGQQLWPLVEQYYQGKHRQVGVTEMQKTDKALMELHTPTNFCAVIINEPTGYIARASFVVKHQNPRITKWAERWLKRRLRPALKNLAKYQGMYGEAYLYLNVDDTGVRQGVKVRALPPFQDGEVRVTAQFQNDDEEEVRQAAISYKDYAPGSSLSTDRRVLITEERIEVYERVRNPGREEEWRLVEGDINPYGLVPLVRVANHRDESDINDIIPLQDDLNTGKFDYRAARRFHGFPMLATSGTIGAALAVSPGVILEKMPDLKRIDAADLIPMLEGSGVTVQEMAILGESLMIANLRGSELSGAAIERLQDAFQNKINGKAAAIGSATALMLSLVARMIYESGELYDLESPTDENGDPIGQEEFAEGDFEVECTAYDQSDELRQQEMDDHGVQNQTMSRREYARNRGRDADRMWTEILEEERQLAEAQAKAEPQFEVNMPRKNQPATRARISRRNTTLEASRKAVD